MLKTEMKKKTLGILNVKVLSPTLEPWHGSEQVHLNAFPGPRLVRSNTSHQP